MSAPRIVKRRGSSGLRGAGGKTGKDSRAKGKSKAAEPPRHSAQRHYLSKDQIKTDKAPAKAPKETKPRKRTRVPDPALASAVLSKCILVAGMHRSGTSAVTRVINLMGADISSDLMPPVIGNNERGFWESRSIAAIHDRLLVALDSAWDDVFPLSPHWLETDAARQAQGEISRELEANFADSRVFVIKDPRLARLLPLWIELLDKRRIEAVIVMPFRNPLEVALSLKERDGFSLGKSMLLYAQSCLEAERASRRRPRTFIAYDELLRDWRTLAKRLKTANVGFGAPDQKIIFEIERFLSADLRHATATRRDLAEHREISAIVVEIYDRLTDAAKSGSDAALRPAFDRMRRTLSEAIRLFGAASPIERASAQATSAAVQQRDVPAPEAQSAASDALPKGHSEALREAESTSGEIAAPNQADPAIVHALQLMAETRSDLARRLDEVSAHAGNLEGIRLSLAKELAAAAATAAQATNQIARLEAERAELIRQLADERARIAEMLKERSVFEHQLEDLQALVRNLQSKAETADALARRSESSLDSLATQLDEARTLGAEALASRDALQTQVGEARSEAHKFEMQAQQAEARTQQHASQLELLTKELEAARARADEDRSEAEASELRARESEALAQEQAARMTTVTVELDAVRAGAAELLVARDAHQGQAETARSELKQLTQRANESEALSQQQALQLKTLTKDLREARAGAAELVAARDGLRRQLDEARAELRKLELRVQEAELRSQVQALKIEVIAGNLIEKRDRVQAADHLGPIPQAETSSAVERTAGVIRNSGLFDPDYYRQRAACAALDPVVHYVTAGEKLGIPPSTRFDPTYYAERYPDVGAAGTCLLEHYVLHGQNEGRRATPVANDFVEDPARFAPDKETILLVSHEASRTGAPILALAIGQLLSARYNVISLLLRPGDLIENFEEISSRTIYLEERYRSPIEFKYAIASLLRGQPIRYALICSIESRDIIPALARAFIPTINLIHEFSTYTRPLRTVREALGWTTELVFSASITAESFRKEHQALEHRKIHIIPQGRCSLPAATSKATLEAEFQTIKSAMRPTGAENALVVLGVGTVHLRKGIDLFISTATAAVRMAARGRPIRFVWIGHGYDPQADMNYSVYLAEQIVRSGSQGHVVILDPVGDLEPAYAMADVFYLPSRLDPLPNVTIDAAFRALPVICFEGATGMAEVLKQDPTAGATVMPYLDAEAAARQIVELANDEALRTRVGESTRSLALRTFEMERYAGQIDEIGGLAVERMRQRRADFETILKDPLFDPEIFTPPNASPTTREDEISRFLAYWSAARTAPHQLDHLDLRRPCAGFNPQIYAHHHPEILEADINPLADFIRKGCPQGPWVHETIGPDLDKMKQGPQNALRVAIQAHFHYPELIEDFLDRIALNKASCDLLLSTNDVAKAALLGARTTSFDRGLVKIRIVPNRGRDIAPLLTVFGREMVRDYDVIGHLHGKRSSGVDAAMGETWREFLWQHLLGPRYPMMDIALAHFAENEQLGLLFPEEPHLCDWGANLAIADDLARGAGLERPLPPFFEFPVGSMFWARTRALAPLIELALTWDHYPEEPVANDGTMLHALERLFPFAARKQGYSYATVHIPGISR